MSSTPVTAETITDLRQIMRECGMTAIQLSDRFLQLLNEHPEPTPADEDYVLTLMWKAIQMEVQRPARAAGKLGNTSIQAYHFASAALEVTECVLAEYLKYRRGMDYGIPLTWSPVVAPQEWGKEVQVKAIDTVVAQRSTDLINSIGMAPGVKPEASFH